MEITHKAIPNGVVVVTPVGKLNMVHAHRLREEVDAILAKDQNRTHSKSIRLQILWMRCTTFCKSFGKNPLK